MLAATRPTSRGKGPRAKGRGQAFANGARRVGAFMLARPGTVAMTLLFGGLGAVVSANALWMQSSHHPAPLFRQAALQPQHPGRAQGFGRAARRRVRSRGALRRGSGRRGPAALAAGRARQAGGAGGGDGASACSRKTRSGQAAGQRSDRRPPRRARTRAAGARQALRLERPARREGGAPRAAAQQ